MGLREAELRASEGGLRGRLREASKSGQWTPRKRSSEERSGGLYEPEAWRLCYTEAGAGTGPEGGRNMRCFGLRFGARFGPILGIILELILEVIWDHLGGHFGGHFGDTLE